MSSFLENLKKELSKDVELEEGLTYEEYLTHFYVSVKANIGVRIDAMNYWLSATNVKVSKTFTQFPPGKIVAVQDAFSKAMEERMLAQIDTWVRQDEGLRVRYTKLCEAYSKKLKSVDMEQKLKLALEDFNEDFNSLVALANSYAIDWKLKFEKVSFTLTDRKAVNTLTWFSTLTVDLLKKDYERELGKLNLKS